MHENDVAIVTFNDVTGTGDCFWQADLFVGAKTWSNDDWNNVMEPDAFFTMPAAPEIGAQDAERRAAEKWPGCVVHYVPDSDDDDDWDD